MTAQLTDNEFASLCKCAELRGQLGFARDRIRMYRAVMREVLECYPSPDGSALLHEALYVEEELAIPIPGGGE